MELKKVNTEIFYREFETYGSFPSLFHCSDGFNYIVKHSQQNRNYKHMINELIAVQLAKIVSIPVPDFALVEIKKEVIPSDVKFLAGLPSGLGFGSKFLPGNISIVSDINSIISFTKSKKNYISEDLIRILAFDIWLRNIDRSPNNPNLIFQESGNIIRLYAIDHSSIFSELNYIDLGKEVNEPPSIGETLVDKELCLNIYFNYGIFFNEIKHSICKCIEEVDSNKIRDILDNIPVEWKLSSEEKESIFNFINERKTKVENHFDFLLKQIGI